MASTGIQSFQRYAASKLKLYMHDSTSIYSAKDKNACVPNMRSVYVSIISDINNARVARVIVTQA